MGTNNTINTDDTRTGGMGKVNQPTLKAIFPASPIYEAKDQFAGQAALKEFFEKEVLDGVVNDGGHTFGTFNRDYVDAPDLAEVKTGGGGDPASPWVPNPVSPGPGSMNPTDQPDPPSGFGEEPNDQFGTGVGSQLSPKTSSETISLQKVGELAMGTASSS